MLTCRWQYAMIRCICTSVHSFLSINLSPSQSLSRISLHLSVFEPNKFNQHTFPLILQQQTADWVFKPGKPLSTVGSPVGPAWRRSRLCGRGRRESIWASKAPEGLWGCCQQEKKWLHSLTWWVFGFRCHRSEALSDRVLLFKCPFEVGARKVTTLAVTAGLVQWQADGRSLSLVLNLSGFFGLLVYSKVKRNVKLSDPVPGHYQNVPWQGLGMM